MNAHGVFLGTAFAAAAIAAHAHGQCKYEVTVVEGPRCPPFGVPTSSWATDLDERGHMVGYYLQCGSPSYHEASRWTATEGLVELPRGQFAGATTHAINRRGEIVGRLESPYRGALWRDGEMTFLVGPPESTRTQAEAINSHGVIAGWWGNTIDGPGAVAALWKDGEMVDLGPIVGGVRSEAMDINDAGDIAGIRRLRDEDERIAFLLRDGQVIDLGPIPGGYSSLALAINSRGEIVGYGRLDGALTQDRGAFLWSDGEMHALPSLPGFSRCYALDTNDRGEIVGYCKGAGSARVAVIWRDGVPIALDELLEHGDVLIDRASAINDAGQIAGQTARGNACILTRRPIIAGDVTCDGVVGMSDLLQVLSRWGPCGLCTADLDRDRFVGPGDLTIVLRNWTP